MALLKALAISLGLVTVLLLIERYQTPCDHEGPCEPDSTYIVTTNNVTINHTPPDISITNEVNLVIEKLELKYYTNSIAPTFNNNGVASLIVSNIYLSSQPECFE